MSDISFNIRLNDYMSSTLKTMNQTMQQSIQIMRQLDNQIRTVGAGGNNGFNHLSTELSALTAQVQMLSGMISSIGTGAGPGNAMFQQLNAQLAAAQSHIAALQSQLASLGQGDHSPQMNQLTNELEEARRRIQQLEGQLQQLHNGNNNGGGKKSFKFDSLFSGIEKVKDAFSKLGQVAKIADEFTNANVRLNTINDGLRTQAELQQQVLNIANNTGTSYTATADMVMNMGRTKQFAGDNEGALRFTDLVNKSLNISGAKPEEASNVMQQLSEAMASGSLKGEQFNEIMKNGGSIAGVLSTELGVNAQGLQKMAEEGKLTATVVANAIMKQGAVIDEEFAKMPRTFGQNIEVMKNLIGSWLADLAQSEGALGKLNQLFTDFLNWLTQNNAIFDGLSAALFVVVHLIELLASGFGYVMQVVDALGPVFDAVVYGVIATGLLIATQAALGLVASLLEGLPALVTTAAAWMAINWPIVLIGAAIGGLIAILMHFGVSASDILTFVGGLFGGLVAFIGNNAIFFINIFITVCEFLANVFVDPVYAVKMLFYNLVESIIGFMNGLINGIREGLNWLLDKVEDVTGLKIGHIAEWVVENPLEKPTSDKDVVEYDRLNNLEYGDFAQAGADLVNGFLQNKSEQSLPGMGNAQTLPTDIDSVNKVDKVGKIDNDVNIADEDMKMLMELAIQNRVNQINLSVQTSAPNVTQNNIVNNEMDIQTVANEITTSVYDVSKVMVEQAY